MPPLGNSAMIWACGACKTAGFYLLCKKRSSPLTSYLGEIASLLTALCWSVTAIFFAMAGQQFGSVVANRIRLALAVLLLALLHWLLLGSPLPLGAERERWFWLGLSGIAGLALGDAFLFQSYIWIGPRLAMLLMSLAPVISALLAWLFLAETLSFGQVSGILLAVGGIAWVVLEKSNPAAGQVRGPRYGWGILLGLGAATGQALGLVLAKKGLGGDFPALSGNLIRMLAAGLAVWSLTLAQNQAGSTLQRLKSQRRALLHILAGTISGPVVGVWLSLVAIQLAHVGVASTLMALPPIFMLPITYFLFNDRFGRQAILGTLVAMCGVALLFMV